MYESLTSNYHKYTGTPCNLQCYTGNNFDLFLCISAKSFGGGCLRYEETSGDNVNRMSMVVWSVTHVFSFSVHIINGFILLQTHAVLIDILDIL